MRERGKVVLRLNDHSKFNLAITYLGNNDGRSDGCVEGKTDGASLTYEQILRPTCTGLNN